MKKLGEKHMKRIASLLLTLSLVLCVLMTLTFSVNAASTDSQDGLTITITTDKAEYSSDEDIQVSVNIKNNNSYKVENVSVETLLPEGLVLKNGNLVVTGIDVDAGDSYIASVVAKLATSGGDRNLVNPQTGDSSNIVLWVFLIVVSSVSIFLTFKYKRFTQILSLLLCFVMTLTILPLGVFAAENNCKTIDVSTSVNVGGQQFNVAAKVTYEYNEQTQIQTFSSAEEYYRNNAEVISVIDAEASNEMLTETQAIKLLEELGFVDYPITYEYLADGSYCTETRVSEDSTEMHPTYQTLYVSENDELWAVYVINGSIFANPVSFNYISDLDAQVLVSASDTLTSYDDETNKYYVTIPYESEIIIEIVDRIDAEVLDSLTVEEICKWSGATPPSSADEDSYSVESVMKFSSSTPYSTTTVSAAEQNADDPVIVVSLGDSYSSGEGILPFYGQDKALAQKVQDQGWLAHRSTKSWPSLLKIPGITGTMGDYLVKDSTVSSNNVQWYFGAVSGAETKHFQNSFTKKYDQDVPGLFNDDLTGSVDLPPQVDIFNTINGTVDYVTLTIGGNDVNFAGIMTTCAVESSYLFFGSTSKLEKELKALWNTIDTTMVNIRQVYEDVAKAAPYAEIIVAGYPKLINPKGGGVVISKKEATLVNQITSDFNDKIEELVAECRKSGMNIHFVDVEAEFDKDGGHQAYCKTAWINGIIIPAQKEDLNDEDVSSAFSIHPNELGAQAYARCVNAKIAEIEATK